MLLVDAGRSVVGKVRSVVSRRPNLRQFLVCALIVFCAFPDVILTGASISMLDKFRVPLEGREHRSFYPEKSTTQPEDGFYDSDGAALQSEPMIQFLKHSIYTLQSPYWNPYSGAGSVGPETMVDTKFAPLSVMTALLGGSNLAFHFVSLLIFSAALFFLSLVCTRFWRLSPKATTAVCFAYLLNGYVTANLSSNTNQAYFFFPLALFAVLQFSERQNFTRFIVLILAYVLPLTVSFFPTTVLMLTAVTIFAAASVVSSETSLGRRLRLLLMHAVAPVLAGSILAFQYLPLAETLKITAALDQYGLRPFYPANWQSLMSLFAAKTLFESYGGIDPRLGPFMTNVVFHFGILAGVIAALAIFNRETFKNTVLAAAVAMLFVSLGRIFGLPGLSVVIDHVPFFRNLGEQYWWMMVACCFPVVFAHGLRSIESVRYRIWPAVLVAVVFFVSLVCTWRFYGLPSVDTGAPIHRLRAIYYVVRAILMIIAAIGGLYVFKKYPIHRPRLLSLVAFGIFFELIFYANSTRVTRTDLFKNPPEYVQFVKKNIGLQRLANYGAHGLPAEVGSGFQLQQIEFFAMNLVPAYSELCQRAITNQHGWQGQGFCANRDPQLEPNVNPDVLNMLSVRYIVVSKFMPKFVTYFEDHKYPHAFESRNILVFENPDAFPRAYGVNHLVAAPETPETKGFSARTVAFTQDQVLLEEAAKKGIKVDSAPETAARETRTKDARPSVDFENVKIADYKNTEVRLEADFSAPGIMILPDNWHPNWSAKVDGEPTYIGKVNQTFRGIALSPGRHIIELSYQPKTLRAGIGLSLTTILILLAGLFISYRRQRK